MHGFSGDMWGNNILLTILSPPERKQTLITPQFGAKRDLSRVVFVQFSCLFGFFLRKTVAIYPPCPTFLAILARSTGLNKVLLGLISPWRFQKVLEGLSFLRSLACLPLRSFGFCSSRGLVSFPSAAPSQRVRSVV